MSLIIPPYDVDRLTQQARMRLGAAGRIITSSDVYREVMRGRRDELRAAIDAAVKNGSQRPQDAPGREIVQEVSPPPHEDGPAVAQAGWNKEE
mgnify:FL=1